MAPRQKLDVSTQNAANRRLGTGLDSKIRRRSTEAIQTMERMGFDPMVAAIHTFRKIDQEIFELQALKNPDGQVLNKDGSMRRFSMRALTELYGHQIKICSELLKYRYAKVPEITGNDQNELPAMTVRLSGGVRAGVHRINGGSNVGAQDGAYAPQAVQDDYGQGQVVPLGAPGGNPGPVTLGPGHADVTIVSDDEIRAYAADRVASESLRSVAQDRIRELAEKLAQELPGSGLDDRVVDESVQGGAGGSILVRPEDIRAESGDPSSVASSGQDGFRRVEPEEGAADRRLRSGLVPAESGHDVQGSGPRTATQDQAGAVPARPSVNPGKLKVPSFGYPHSTGPSILKPPVPMG